MKKITLLLILLCCNKKKENEEVSQVSSSNTTSEKNEGKHTPHEVSTTNNNENINASSIEKQEDNSIIQEVNEPDTTQLENQLSEESEDDSSLKPNLLNNGEVVELSSIKDIKATNINIMEECSIYKGLDSLDLSIWQKFINESDLIKDLKNYLKERFLRVEFQATGKIIESDLENYDEFVKKDIKDPFFKKDPENFTAKFCRDKLLKLYIILTKFDEEAIQDNLKTIFQDFSNGAKSCSLGLAEAADASLIYCLNMFNMINDHADLALGIKMNELNEQLIEESIKGFSNMENHQRYYIKKKVGLISSKFIDDTMDQHIDYDYLENLSKKAVKAFDNYKIYILYKIKSDAELRHKALACLEEDKKLKELVEDFSLTLDFKKDENFTQEMLLTLATLHIKGYIKIKHS